MPHLLRRLEMLVDLALTLAAAEPGLWPPTWPSAGGSREASTVTREVREVGTIATLKGAYL